MLHYEEDLSLLEKIETVKNLLIGVATGSSYTNEDDRMYKLVRKNIIEDPALKQISPNFLITIRDLSHFWGYIQPKFSTYRERRDYLHKEFQNIFTYLENGSTLPHEETVEEVLKIFNEETVSNAWKKALDRVSEDPDGAITTARSILEAVCKHILDREFISYARDISLADLYKKTATLLNLAPEQHQEAIFKQILGGCSGIISGLGEMRNKLGDAHGKGRMAIKAKPRHAYLAVNLAGSMSAFIASTYLETR